VAVGVLEPMLGGLAVVAAFDLPLGLEPEVFLEAAGEAVRRHDAAGEEVARHPVGAVLGGEVVGGVPVREDVEEELAAGLEPAGDAPHELAPVLHVLEHLDGDDAVVARGLGGEDVHVAGEDADVPEAALGALAFDVGALGRGVRDAGDAGVGVFLRHPEGERAPAAAELEDLHAVLQFRAGAGAREHGLLGLAERFGAGLIITGGVFQAGTEAELIERGRHFVVLLVGGLGLDGHGERAQLGGEGFDLGEAGRGVGRTFVGEPLPEQAADAPADHAVGQDVFFDERVEQRHGSNMHAVPGAGNPSPRKNQPRGGRGQKAGTRRW